MHEYKIKNETGKEICVGILMLFFGHDFKSTLDRLNHKWDGYVTTIYYNGSLFKVYRVSLVALKKDNKKTRRKFAA